jgi:hypothetical protein
MFRSQKVIFLFFFKLRELKVRVSEYDATGFVEGKEKSKFQEFLVTKISKHPDFAESNLYNNIAVLTLEKPIDLINSNGINAACLPTCNDMFEYQFANGTGTRYCILTII